MTDIRVPGFMVVHDASIVSGGRCHRTLSRAERYVMVIRELEDGTFKSSFEGPPLSITSDGFACPHFYSEHAELVWTGAARSVVSAGETFRVGD